MAENRVHQVGLDLTRRRVCLANLATTTVLPYHVGDYSIVKTPCVHIHRCHLHAAQKPDAAKVRETCRCRLPAGYIADQLRDYRLLYKQDREKMMNESQHPKDSISVDTDR